MTSNSIRRRTLFNGSRGGVGRAVCALLERRPDLLERTPTEMFLLDAQSEPEVARPFGAQVLPPLKLDGTSLRRLLRELEIQELIDCSTLDTAIAIDAAVETNTDYLSTSISTDNLTTHVAVERLYAGVPATKNSLLVCSGMNPGIVNALAFAGMDAFAKRVGVEANPRALELQSLLVTEQDTTERADDIPEDESVFAMTWGPEIALQELCEPSAVYWSKGVHGMEHPPWGAFYRVRCGDEQVEGFLVPHEEVFTLGARLEIPEVAFVYRLPGAAQRRLLNAPETHAEWPLRRLTPPEQDRLRGSDRVGVLLVSARYGELWIGFDTPVEAGAPYKTNGTLLQVAAGVIAGWNQLGERTGLHVPEELDYRRYMSTVSAVLGEPLVVYDPDARAVPLAERRVA